jgi:DNA primase catalytic subunit
MRVYLLSDSDRRFLLDYLNGRTLMQEGNERSLYVYVLALQATNRSSQAHAKCAREASLQSLNKKQT